MGAEITDTTAGTVTVRVVDRLTEAELAEVQHGMAAAIQDYGTIRVLVIAEDFAGWGRGRWADLSFQAQYDRCIEKMAIVGDAKWQDLALGFTAKGLRPFPIEYFASDALAQARAWLIACP